jgi:hypothetical protein
MASSGQILALDEAIDDQIVAFCKSNTTLDVEAAPDVDAMRDAISYSEPDIAISAGAWHPSRDLITFQPIGYEARFSELPGSNSEFSLSIAHRGIELPADRARFNHRYPFPVLADPVDVPIMHPDEILAEKIVAWLLFGHAKHYNDIAFLVVRMRYAQNQADLDADRRQQVRRTIESKLKTNESVSSAIARRVQALASEPERRRRLEEPDDHVDPKRNFDTLSYLHGQAPERRSVKTAIDEILLPMLFD